MRKRLIRLRIPLVKAKDKKSRIRNNNKHVHRIVQRKIVENMPTLKEFENKIRRYLSKLTNNRIKEKLIQLVLKIGISAEESELIDENPKQLVFPCVAGIAFFEDSGEYLFERIKNQLDLTFEFFFFNVKNLVDFNLSSELLSKGIREEYKRNKESSEKLFVHPTNKFYQALINKRSSENIDMIVGITNLPIYSSSNDNIIFLFGETHLKYRCSVVSTLNLKEQFYNRSDNDNLFSNRVIKEVLHEIGHLILGPVHCTNYNCLMRFSKEIKEIDEKGFDLCPECAVKLKEIKKKFNF